jgi:hypothetical protein
MDAAFSAFRKQFETAIAAQLAGDSGPFKELWSHKPDVMIFGAQGGMEKGWPEVGDRLDWVSGVVRARLTSVENVSTVINGTIALTADLEHMVRSLDGREFERTLRVTQSYRFEDGMWKIFYRHGDEFRPSGPPAGSVERRQSLLQDTKT